MLVLAGMLNYLDRATLAVANQVVQAELHIPISSMGLLLSAFLWAYALSQLPVGVVIDWYGPRRVLAVSLFGWSIAQAAGGFVTNFAQFATARAALGIGEAPLFPTGARVVRDWFNIRQRGLAIGICQAAASFGSFIAIPLLTFVMLRLNWRWMFILAGALGAILSIAWWSIHRDPAETYLSAEEKSFLSEVDAATTSQPSWSTWAQLFRSRTTWGMVAGFFGLIYTIWLYTSWLPFYLEHERHMSIAKAGMLASIPFLCGFIGGILGGWLCDLLVAKGMQPMASRKVLVAVSMLLSALCGALIPFVVHDATVLFLISASMFATYVAASAAWATVPIAAPAHLTASLGSIQNFGGYIGGALAPLLTGILVERTGNFRQPLLLNAAITFIAAMLYIALTRGSISINEDRHLAKEKA
ncbi:MAG: MFS transporter [Acidobacteria bacterium]|nr:MFS transporter [Acidobacteriota bacterium]